MAEAKETKMTKLTPPAQFIRECRHHWLERLDRFNGPKERMIAQWNPGSATWSHSNGHDTLNGGLRSLNEDHCDWIWLEVVAEPLNSAPH